MRILGYMTDDPDGVAAMKLLPLLAAVLLALAMACSGGDSATESEVAGDRPSAPETDDAVVADSSSSGPGTSTEAAHTPPTAGGGTRFVGNTGGQGVSVRTGCLDIARTGDALPDATEVQVIETGSGNCEEWSLVSWGGGNSWIRDVYLLDEPSIVALTSGPSTDSASAGGSTTPPLVSAPVASPTATPAAIPTFVSLTGDVVTFATLDVIPDVASGARLRGGPTGLRYLGLIDDQPTEESICNQYGPYGSPRAPDSARNQDGAYGATPGTDPGSPYYNSPHSAYNPTAAAPPRVVLLGATVGYLTKNTSLFGASAIDPDALFAYLGCLY